MYKVDQEALDAELGPNTPKLIVDPIINQPELPKHADRILMWLKDHKPEQKLPMIQLGNEIIWLNRAERRKRNIK